MEGIESNLVILSLLLGAVMPWPKLAIVARFYYPFPDSRTSYQRVYVTNREGKRSRPLSLPGQRCQSVAWAGRNRLVYEVLVDSSDSWKTELWTAKFPDGKPRRIAPLFEYLDRDTAFESAADGMALVRSKDRIVRVVAESDGRLLPFQGRKNGWLDPFEGKDGRFQAAAVRSNSIERYPVLSVDEENRAILRSEGSEVELDMPIWFGWHHPSSNRLWLGDSPSMHSQRLMRVRWERGEVQELFHVGYAFDWRPDRLSVAYVTQRGLSPYGPDKTVWTSELWTGELETGAKRRVPAPLAYFADVAVRPD